MPGSCRRATARTRPPAPRCVSPKRCSAAQSGADYAVDAVLERLPSLIGPPAGEVVVETTIDGTPAAPRPGAGARPRWPTKATAPTPARPASCSWISDGGIRALVGGRSYAESQFNRALKAKRQPGSAFKMFVYLAALESGLKPDSTVLDLPILGSGLEPAQRRRRLSRRRHPARGAGPVDECRGRAAHMTVGPRKTAAVARRLGIRSELRARRLARARHLGGDAAGADRRLRRARQRRPGARPAHRSRACARLPARCCIERQAGAADGAGGAGARRRHERHAGRRARRRARASAPRCPASRRRQDRHDRRISAMPGSSATRRISSPASGSATTTAGP